MISKIESTIEYVDDKNSVTTKQTNAELNVILERLKQHLQEEIDRLKSEITIARGFRDLNEGNEAYSSQHLVKIIDDAEKNVQANAEAYIGIIDGAISNGRKTDIDNIIKDANQQIREIHKVIDKLDNHKANTPQDPGKQLIPALKGKFGWWPGGGGFPHDIQSGGAPVNMESIMGVLHDALVINDPSVSTLNNYASNMFYDAITFLSISINLPYGDLGYTNTDSIITSIINYVNEDILTPPPAVQTALFKELPAFFVVNDDNTIYYFNQIFNNICESFYNTKELPLVQTYLLAKNRVLTTRKHAATVGPVATAGAASLVDAYKKEFNDAKAALNIPPKAKSKEIKLGDFIQNMKEDIDKIILNTIKKSEYLKYLQFTEEPVQKTTSSFGNFGFGKKTKGGQKTQKNRNISKNRGGSRKNMNSIDSIEPDDSIVPDDSIEPDDSDL